MKYIIGFITLLLALLAFTYIILKVWEIDFISKENLGNIYLTTAIAAVGAIVLTVIIAFFFKNPSKGYEKTDSVVQRKEKR